MNTSFRNATVAMALTALVSLTACSTDGSVTPQDEHATTPTASATANVPQSATAAPDGALIAVPFTPESALYAEESMEVLETHPLSAYAPEVYLKRSHGTPVQGHSEDNYHFQLNDSGEDNVLSRGYVSFKKLEGTIPPSVTFFKLKGEKDDIHALFLLPEDSRIAVEK